RGPQGGRRRRPEDGRPQAEIVADLAAARDVEPSDSLTQHDARGEEAREGRHGQQEGHEATRTGRPTERRGPREALDGNAAQEQIGRSERAVYGPDHTPREDQDQRRRGGGHLLARGTSADVNERNGAAQQGEQQSPAPRRVAPPAISPRDARGWRTGH